MKLKMKTTAILIAVLMISAFAVAIPTVVAPEPVEGNVVRTESGDGTAEWTKVIPEPGLHTAAGLSAPYVVKLTNPMDADWDDFASVKVYYGKGLDTITNANLRYWYSYDGVPHNSFVSLYIDTTGGDTVDVSLTSRKQDSTVYDGTWTETVQELEFWEGRDYNTVTGSFEYMDPRTFGSIADWTTTYSLAKVIYVAIGWGPTTVPALATESIYIDDFTIGGTTYPLEPGLEFPVDADPYVFHIAASSEGEGSITPEDVTLTLLTAQLYTMTPDTYWKLSELLVDGESVLLELVDDTYTIDPADLIPNLIPDPEISEHIIHATFEPETIGISVVPLSYSFESVPIGGTSETTVTVTNTGDIDVYVDASLADDDGFFSSFLYIDDLPVKVVDWTGIDIPEEPPVEIDLLLDLRSATVEDAGHHSATLVFEITPPEPAP